MNRVKLLLACLCLLTSTMASAGVVYTWRTTVSTPDMRSLNGFIELSDAAVAAGHVSYQAPSCDPWPCSLSDPASPIMRFGFKVNQDRPSALAINLIEGSGYDFPMPAFNADFDIAAGRLVNLRLFVNTMSSTLQLGGDVIEWFSSDADNCYFGCSGAEGQFVAADVAEPRALALFVLALAAAALAGRRRQA